MGGVNESDWSFFSAQWGRYKTSTKLTGESEAQHLWAACSSTLQRSLHNAGAGSITDPVALMAQVKELAVKKRNNLVNIIELQGMGQQHSEKVSTFIARLNGKAELCDYLVECPSCHSDVSYKEKTIMYQLVRGLADRDMQEKVLQAAAQVEGGELSLVRVVKLCEALEVGKVSQDLITSTNGSINRVSEYQQGKAGKRTGKREQGSGGAKGGSGCSNCGSREHSSRLVERRDKCKAFMETCPKCGVLGHYGKYCKGGTREQRAGKNKDKSGGKVTAVTAETSSPASASTPAEAEDQSGTVGTLTGSWMKIDGRVESAQLGVLETKGVRMPHKECGPGGSWRSCNVEPHGRLELSLRVCKPAYEQLKLRVPPRSRAVRVSAMADTGAQMCVGDLELAERLGLVSEFLVGTAMSVTVANNDNLRVRGAGFMEIVTASGKSTKQMVYFARGVRDFYLSKVACRELGIIGEEFPGSGVDGAALCPLTDSTESRNLGGSSPCQGESSSVAVDKTLTVPSPTVPGPPVECEDVGPDWGVNDLRVQGPGGRNS